MDDVGDYVIIFTVLFAFGILLCACCKVLDKVRARESQSIFSVVQGAHIPSYGTARNNGPRLRPDTLYQGSDLRTSLNASHGYTWPTGGYRPPDSRWQHAQEQRLPWKQADAPPNYETVVNCDSYNIPSGNQSKTEPSATASLAASPLDQTDNAQHMAAPTVPPPEQLGGATQYNHVQHAYDLNASGRPNDIWTNEVPSSSDIRASSADGSSTGHQTIRDNFPQKWSTFRRY